MRLKSDNGVEVGLTVDSYQFPDMPGEGDRDWDANWLVVSGYVNLPDGRAHSFAAPCLTSWEAAELGDWLIGLSKGDVPDAGDGPTLVFLEPCLAFGATGLEGGDVELRVYLSLEAAPPFVVNGRAGTFENYVAVRTDSAALKQASDEWADDIGPFPVRGRFDP